MILKMGKSHENKDAPIFLERHPLHDHPLRLQEAQGPYKCNGCKQPGFKRCFKCPEDICDFYLHEVCFRAEHYPERTHELMEECGKFKFHQSLPRVANKYCDACGLDILGFRYECSTHGENPHDLHPTCVNIKSGKRSGRYELELSDKVESKCLHCKQRYPAEECVGFTGWKWISEERHYGFPSCFSGRKICFHVKCMNEIEAPKEKEA